MNTGLLFSGQGAQSVGMAKSLCESSKAVKEMFEESDKTLGFPISQYCFEGPMEILTKTSVCQPALYLHGMAVVQILREKGKLGDVKTALGLSLGELTAHAFAGTYDVQTGLKIVAERGRLMQEACESTKGAMASLIGATPDFASKYAKEFDVDISNLNCPGQIVVSGESEKIAQLLEAAKNRKEFKMAIPLKVAGAYHSRLMESAREKFEKFLKTITFSTPSIPVFTNVTGEMVSDPEEIKKNLVKQVVSTVKWTDCMLNASKLGVELFYECGPGGVLAGLGKRINKDISIKSLSELQDFV